MKKFFYFLFLGIILMVHVSCGNSESSPRYANENDAAIGLIKEAQPELSNDMMRVVEKADRHDGGGSHLGYNMVVYNERTNLYLPLIVTVWPTSKEVKHFSKDLRTQPYENPRYDSDAKFDSRWVSRDQIEVNRNPFNGDTEFGYR